ncbi:MAG TPA: F0F1 ATP synthase subunit gamma [Desulfobacteraceae bacterium]|nr:F0F1 ATP synthase subunit gamma [Desulfobacteraceae bacterium]
METIEDLKRKITSTEDLKSVVRTMKALAAVKIRQFEKAVEALKDYHRTIEMGLQAVLRNRADITIGARAGSKNLVGAVVFGSDQGMCGQINDQIVSHAMTEMNQLPDVEKENRFVVAVGQRVYTRMQEEGQKVEAYVQVPGSVTGIIPKVHSLLSHIDSWQRERNVEQIFLYYNRQVSASRYEPCTVHLLPVDKQWLERIGKRKWPGKSLPLFTMDWDPLFSALIRQYLFVSLHRAFAESLASENASRLTSMQGAEKNISEQLDSLLSRFHQQRQMAITGELLDIVAGFEVLGGDN